MIFKETIDMLIYEVLGKFNLEYFKNLSKTNIRPQTKEEETEMAYSGRSHPEIEYAKKFLPSLGFGSARITFALSGNKVLKIAKNQRGLAQNQAEFEIFYKNQGTPFVTKIFDKSDDYKWIISEIVKPLSKEEFEQRIMDGTVFYLIRETVVQEGRDPKNAAIKWLKHLYYLKNRGEMFFEGPHEETRKISQVLPTLHAALQKPEKFDWLKELFDFIRKNNLDFGDIVPDHFGRTVDDRIILFDYGLTVEVGKAHYGF